MTIFDAISFETEKLTNIAPENLFIGQKALIYLHSTEEIQNNFW